MEVREEIGVVRIEKIDDTIRKEDQWYITQVQCVLADGRRVEHIHRSRRKRDVKVYLASLPREVAGVTVTLIDGKPIMWSQAYDL